MALNLVGSRYEILDLIGQGGMGSVYRALDRLTGALVALKRVRLNPESTFAATDGDTQPRIELAREFETLASLHHPYIISVLDYGFDDMGHPFLTMSLLEGAHSIRDVVRESPRDQQIRYIIQMLQALAYLHRHNIIHRDIKPGNILIDHDSNEVRVVDFGLAMLGGVSETLDGTPAYIAPEIFNGKDSSRASDLYSLGLILYEIFAGQFPYRTQTFHTLIHDIVHFAPPMNVIPPEFVPLISRLLEKDPLKRYNDADAVIADLCVAAKIPFPEESQAIRESFLQSAVFVGRDAELKRLRHALENTISGSGSGWLIGGESGVGKSRLLHELRTYAMVKGVQVLRAPAFEQEGLTLSFWRDLIRQFVLAFSLDDTEASIFCDFVPDMEGILGRLVNRAPRLSMHEMQQRALLTMIGVMLRQNRPTLLILEDLHWTDDLSILEQFSPFLDTLPFLVVGTYRNDERPNVPQRLPEMQVLTLGRLSEQNIEELSVFMLGEAGHDPDLLALLQRETEGNVFFLTEVLRTLAQDVGDLDSIGQKRLPESIFTEGIRSIVQRRLDRLAYEHHPMLRVAALYGRQIDLKILRCIDNEIDYDSWLIHCANVALLEKDSSNLWQFAHDKLREGILMDVDEHEITKLHCMIAEAIENAYPNNITFSPNLAIHWRMAGDLARERPYALKATEFLVELGRMSAAIQMGERALAIVDPDDMHTLATLRIQLGALAQQMGNLQTASEYLSVGLRDAETAGNERLQERAVRLLAQTEIGLSNWQSGAALVERSYALSKKLDDSQLIADNKVLLALVAGWKHHIDQQKSLYEEAYAIYEIHHATAGLADCLGGLAVIAMAEGDLSQAAAYLENAIQIVRQASHAPRLATILVSASLVAYLRRDLSRAKAFAVEAMMLSDRLGLVGTRIDSRLCLARVHTAEGRLNEAQGALRVALKSASDYEHQTQVLIVLIEYARLRFGQGNKAAAAEMLCLALAQPRLVEDVRRLIAEPLRDIIKSQIKEEDWNRAELFGRERSIKELIALMASEMGVAV